MEKTPRSITLTRALQRLKTLDKKIESACNKPLIAVIVRGQPSVKDLRAEADFQSAIDLIQERSKLKSLISVANQSTSVTIGDKTMTISEAIERKHSIVYQESLLNSMKAQYNKAIRHKEQHEDAIQSSLHEILMSSAGSKDKSEETAALEKVYLEANKVELNDPIDLKSKIEALEQEILEFNSEVDLSLSEINARTTISV
jgi:hypothetical protein